MRIAIVGSRSITDRDRVYSIADDLTAALAIKKTPLTILSGGAKGTDTLVQEWATERHLDFILMKPYHLLDSKVPYEAKYFFVRNKQMVDNSDLVICIWDGNSKGCFDAARYGYKAGKTVILWDYRVNKIVNIKDFM